MKIKFEYRITYHTTELNAFQELVGTSNSQSFDNDEPLRNRKNAYNLLTKIIKDNRNLAHVNGKMAIDLSLIILEITDDIMHPIFLESINLISKEKNKTEDLIELKKEIMIYKKYQIVLPDNFISTEFIEPQFIY